MIADNYGCVVKTRTSKEGPQARCGNSCRSGSRNLYECWRKACEKTINHTARAAANAGNVEKYEQIPCAKQSYDLVSDTQQSLVDPLVF